MPETVQTLAKVTALLADYAACIDADDLEHWPGYFTNECHYKITTDYNHKRDLPVGLIYAHNKNMLEDRVTALRTANIYEPQRYRHILSVVRLTAESKSGVEAETNFMVVRTMTDGSQDLFATGRYLDKIEKRSEGAWRFAEKLVVLDSDKIDTLLAIPL
jgi:anthranilate 1,2-dioxygenase small subunit